jgi:hypothetical protein
MQERMLISYDINDNIDYRVLLRQMELKENQKTSHEDKMDDNDVVVNIN